MNYTIHKGTVEDWKEACDLTAKIADWNRSYRDFETYQKAYGRENLTFLVARDAELNLLGCGMIAKAKYGISTIAVYFVHPDHRGKGIGNAIFSKLTEESIAEGRNIGLTATSTMSSKFDANRGFNKYQKWKMGGIGLKNIQSDYIVQHYGSADRCRIVDVRDVDLEQLISFDAKISGGLDRSDFVAAWTSHPDGCAKVAIDASNGKIVGYGMGRITTNGTILFCPLYADDEVIAEQLILAIFNQEKDASNRNAIFFSITPNTDKLMAILSKFSEPRLLGYCTNQFTKEVPATNHERVYCMSDPSLGFI